MRKYCGCKAAEEMNTMRTSLVNSHCYPAYRCASMRPTLLSSARVATVTINPNEVTPLHLRPEFESTIRMPEEITSVILGSPGSFKAEHNEGEPNYVYVKPITKQPAQSNLLIATKSGQHVTLELISDGDGERRYSAGGLSNRIPCYAKLPGLTRCGRVGLSQSGLTKRSSTWLRRCARKLRICALIGSRCGV